MINILCPLSKNKNPPLVLKSEIRIPHSEIKPLLAFWLLSLIVFKWRKTARRMANALGSNEIKKSAHRGRLDVAGQRSMGTEKISNPS
jgi:hypothetical protein